MPISQTIFNFCAVSMILANVCARERETAAIYQGCTVILRIAIYDPSSLLLCWMFTNYDFGNENSGMYVGALLEEGG